MRRYQFSQETPFFMLYAFYQFVNVFMVYKTIIYCFDVVYFSIGHKALNTLALLTLWINSNLTVYNIKTLGKCIPCKTQVEQN
jgi:hypothetical protein